MAVPTWLQQQRTTPTGTSPGPTTAPLLLAPCSTQPLPPPPPAAPGKLPATAAPGSKLPVLDALAPTPAATAAAAAAAWAASAATAATQGDSSHLVMTFMRQRCSSTSPGSSCRAASCCRAASSVVWCVLAELRLPGAHTVRTGKLLVGACTEGVKQPCHAHRKQRQRQVISSTCHAAHPPTPHLLQSAPAAAAPHTAPPPAGCCCSG